jgi:hypothetical protein
MGAPQLPSNYFELLRHGSLCRYNSRTACHRFGEPDRRVAETRPEHDQGDRSRAVLARGSQPLLAATVHPSAVLRDRNNRDQAYQLFADDLRGLRAVIRPAMLVAQAVSDKYQSAGSYTDSAVSTL